MDLIYYKAAVKLMVLISLCFVSMAVENPKIEATRGQAVKLLCLLNGAGILPEWQGPPEYTIYNKEGKEYLNIKVHSIAEGRLKWTDNKKDLIISNVQKSDEGHYQCLYYGHGEYQFHLVVIDPVADSSSTPGSVIPDGDNTGLHSPDRYNSGTTVAIALLLWIFICTFGICFLQTKYVKCKFLGDIANHLEVSYLKPKTILLALSCYIFLGWAILLYKVLMERSTYASNMAAMESGDQAATSTAHVKGAKCADQETCKPLLQDPNECLHFDMDYYQHKTAAENGMLPSDEDLFKISSTITCDMELLARPLNNISQETIDHIKNYHKDRSHQICNMLVIWRNKEGHKASHIALVDKLGPDLASHINFKKLKTMFEISDAPHSVKGIPSVNSIYITWTAPHPDHKHGDVIFYKVYFKDDKTTDANEVDSIETTLTNLQADTTYSIQVRACYSSGWSKMSIIYVAKTFSYEINAFEKNLDMGNIYVDVVRKKSVLDRHLRVIVVGHPGHGKTSLTHRLLGKSVHDIDTTPKIALHMNYVSKSNSGIWEHHLKLSPPEKKNKSSGRDDEMTISILDFSGESLFKTTCHILQSRNAIYLVVFDQRCKDAGTCINSKNEKTDKQNCITFWEDSIHWLSRSDEKHPIIYVGTVKDKLKSPSSMEKTLVQQSFQSSHFSIDNINIDESKLILLRKEIEKQFKLLHKSAIPKHWIAFEKKIMGYEGDSVLTLDKVMEINGLLKSSLRDTNEVKAFLQLCHYRGTLIYFNEPTLAFFIIRNPDFLLNAFKVIITSQQFCQDTVRLELLWNRLFLEGYLENELLDVIWGQNEYLLTHKNVLIHFLQRYRIMTRVFHITEYSTNKYLPFYVVPSLLTSHFSHKDLSTFEKKNMKERTNENNDTIVYHKELKKYLKTTHSLMSIVYSFKKPYTIVPTVYQHLTAVALGLWPVVEIKNRHVLCNHLGMYQIGGNYIGSICKNMDIIELKLISTYEKGIDGKYGDKFRRVVEMTIKQEFGELFTKEEMYSLSFRCLDMCHGKDDCKKLYKYEELKKSSNIKCGDSDHEILATEALSEWYVDLGTVQLCALSESLSEEVWSKLAQSIQGDWKEFAISTLDLDKNCFDKIEKDFQHSHALQAFNILLNWQNKQTSPAIACDALFRAIKDCTCITVDWDHIKNTADQKLDISNVPNDFA